MKFKRLCALFLAMLMLAAMLTGCGNSSDEPSAAPENTDAPAAPEENTPADEPPADDGEEPPAEAPSEDSGDISRYITPDNVEELMAGRPSVSLPIVDEETEFTLWTGSPAQDATISGWNDSTAAVEMEARTGVHIDFIEVPPPLQDEQLSLMFVSGEYPDILNYAITGKYSIAYLIDNDFAIDLTDIMEENAPSYMALMDADPALYLATVNDDGQIGGLAGYQYNAFTTTGAIVRSDWVDKIGMKLSDIVTIDDIHDYLTAVKTEGLCEYPMALRYDTTISGSPFLASMGGFVGPADESDAKSFFYNENDELVYGFTTDAYRQYLTMLAQWYDEGLITRDLLNSDRIESSEIANGKYAIFWQDCQFMNDWVRAGQVNDPNFALAGIAEPVLEAGQELGFGNITDITINLVITTVCEDPETALRWLDYHFSEEGSLLCQYGIEGEGLVFDASGKPNYTELISNNPDGLSTDNALNEYTININMYAKDGATQRAAYNSTQQEALNAWNDRREVTKSSFLDLFTLNSDETDVVMRYYTEISTYVAESVARFLTGADDIDAGWDNYVETVKSMNIDEVIAAYESAGERYFGRLK